MHKNYQNFQISRVSPFLPAPIFWGDFVFLFFLTVPDHPAVISPTSSVIVRRIARVFWSDPQTAAQTAKTGDA